MLGDDMFVLFAVSVMELEHGWYRANSPETAARRRRYLDEIFAVIPAESLTSDIGRTAARIDADARKAGQVIATADLFIGATAVHYGYSVCTHNVRHFGMITGLKVLTL